MKKKILSILVLTVFAFTMIAGFNTVMALAEEYPESFTNGSFEEVGNNGMPVGTYASDATKVKLVTNEAHTGKNSIYIETKNGGNPYLGLTASGLVGGARYQLTLWYKGKVESGNGFAVKRLEYAGSEQKLQKDTKAYGTAADWTKITETFYLYEGVTKINFYLRAYINSGYVWYDDFSFKMIEGPKKFTSDTDKVFYYTGNKKGTMTVKLDDYYDNDGFLVDFELSDGKNVISKKENVPFINYEASFEYDPSVFELKKEYKVAARMKDSDGVGVGTLAHKIYRYNRPTAIDENGVYRNSKGEIVQAGFLYHGGGFDTYPECVANGINVVQGTPSSVPQDNINFLNECQKKGMMAAMVMYYGMYPAGNSRNSTNVAKVAEAIKDHPALFGYMVMDEPFSHDENAYEDLRKSYKVIRDIDDTHPILICEDRLDRYEASGKYSDLLVIDPYPGNGNDYGRFVGNRAIEARKAVNYEKPVMGIMQVFTFATRPTPAEVKNMIYQSFMGGTQYIGYFPYMPDDPNTDKPLNQNEFWPVITTFQNNERDSFYKHFSSLEYPTFNKYQSNDLWYETWTDGKDLYVAISNRTNSGANVSIPVVSDNTMIKVNDFSISPFDGGANNVTKNGASFSLVLEARQARCFKIVPTTTPDYSLLSVKPEYIIRENIAKNGSFETLSGNTPEYWGYYLTTGSDATRTTGGSDGNNYVHLTVPTSRLDGDVACEPDSTYLLEFDYKTRVDNTGLVTVDLRPSWEQTGCRLPATDGKWVTGRHMFYVPKDQTEGVTVRLRNMEEGSIDYDNVKVMKVEAGDSNIMLNGSFEFDTPGSKLITCWSKSTNKNAFVDSENKSSGKNSVRLETGADINAWSYARSSRNHVYKLTLDMMAANGGEAAVRVVSYKGNSELTGLDKTYDFKDLEAGKWTNKSMLFSIPADSTRIAVHLINNKGQYINFDNIKLNIYDGCYIADKNGAIIESLEGFSGDVFAKTANLNDNERVYFAIYIKQDGVDMLDKVLVKSGFDDETLLCSENELKNAQHFIKMFIWSDKLQDTNMVSLE